MFESDVQFADTAVREADLCESGAQPPSCSASWSSEESHREIGLSDLLDGVNGRRIRVRRPRAKASEAALPVYNPDFLTPDGSSVVTNGNFDGPGGKRSSAVVERSRNSRTDANIIESLDHRSAPDSTYQDQSSAVASEPSQQHGPSGGYDGGSPHEHAEQPSLQADCSREEAQARMRAWANWVIEMFIASRHTETVAPAPPGRAA